MKNPYDLDAHPYPWDYNPSSWSQRIRVAFLAFVAFVIAIYLGLYQWHLIDTVWDPVFDEQTARVLTSDISHQMTNWIKIPDAILGAWAYLGDLVFALAGCTRRWQFRPWLVILFGLDVIPLGLVSALLIFLQGAVLDNWCFLCIITAIISLMLIILAYDEVWTSTIYLYRVWKKTRNLKLLVKTFWGIPSEEANEIANQMVR